VSCIELLRLIIKGLTIQTILTYLLRLDVYWCTDDQRPKVKLFSRNNWIYVIHLTCKRNFFVENNKTLVKVYIPYYLTFYFTHPFSTWLINIQFGKDWNIHKIEQCQPWKNSWRVSVYIAIIIWTSFIFYFSVKMIDFNIILFIFLFILAEIL
jgi:hypothetical protein